MSEALDNYVIRGVTNNISLLRDIVTEKKFVSGDISTKYLTQVYPDGFKGKVLNQTETNNLLTLAAVVYAKDAIRSRKFLNSKINQSNNNESNSFELVILENGKEHKCQIKKIANNFSVISNLFLFFIKMSFNLKIKKNIGFN
jgi:propionyl-CoA carboxylase alpha chain